MLARQLVEGGTADCVMALGFEKMDRGSLTAKVCAGEGPCYRSGFSIVSMSTSAL